MILESWTETERTQLQQIEVQLLHMFREGHNSNAIYEYLTKCLLWTSARVVVFASLIAGGVYKTQKTKVEEEADMVNLDKRIAKLFEAVNMEF